MEQMDIMSEAGMPPCRGQNCAALRRYVVACRSSALVAGRTGRHDLAARLLELADRVERHVVDRTRADWAAAA
ncbi:MAG: hypothetical protein V9G08_09535 [Dermatophilaceae bacterium]